MEKETSETTFKDNIFQYRSVEKKKLVLSLTITLIVMIVEIIGGFLTNSIALMSDAGHMFTHAFAIGISLFAINLARKPPCHHKTYGLYRAEVLAAFINGLFLIPIVALIMYESILRILYPQEINSFYMLTIAIIGLAVNLTSIFILHGSHKKDLNVRGVFYHMIADAASSVGIVIASIIIFTTGLTIIDPIVSICIAIIILYWAWGILKKSTRILLQMTPKGLNIDIIKGDLKSNFHEILDIFNIHLWTIIPEMLVFSAYVILKDSIKTNNNQKNIISKVNNYLFQEYKIIESTIQITDKNGIEICNIK